MMQRETNLRETATRKLMSTNTANVASKRELRGRAFRLHASQSRLVI